MNGCRIDTYPAHTHRVFMNVALSIDARVVAEARRIAAVRGTTLNLIIRDYLKDLTRVGDVESTLDQLERMWLGSTGRSQGAWTREDLQERP